MTETVTNDRFKSLTQSFHQNSKIHGKMRIKKLKNDMQVCLPYGGLLGNNDHANISYY